MGFQNVPISEIHECESETTATGGITWMVHTETMGLRRVFALNATPAEVCASFVYHCLSRNLIKLSYDEVTSTKFVFVCWHMFTVDGEETKGTCKIIIV